jgi:MarR family transcriptional regulator, organic hydroperoxide resistance regulator
MKRKSSRSRTTSSTRQPKEVWPPLTVTIPQLLDGGRDDRFRETIYAMVQAFSRLLTCREAFGRALGLTGSQFAVLMGTAYLQKSEGISIRALADYIHLAPTHVTTEVGRLIRMGLLHKRVNSKDRRGVLVRLSPRAANALVYLAPFVLRVNNLLFQNVTKSEFDTVWKFLNTFLLNTEHALGEIRRFQREQSSNVRSLTRGSSGAEKDATATLR